MNRHRTSLAVLLALVVPAGTAEAQRLTSQDKRVELAVGIGEDRWTGAASWAHHFGILFGDRLRIGYGVRLSSFRGSDLRFRTSNRDELNGAPTDHATAEDVAIYALNMTIHVSGQVAGRAEIGFNIDMIGVGFGPEQTLASENLADPAITGKPTGFNLLRGGAQDRGTLNSEFYLGLRLGDRMMLRGGLSHFVAEYKTEPVLQNGSTRLRVDGNLAFLALGVNF